MRVWSLVRQLRALMLPPPKQNTRQKQHCNKLNKDFRNGIHQNEVKSLSCVPPHGLYNPWNSLGQNTWVGSCSLLQGTFPTQGSDPGLPHCRQILYQLSHKGSPRILEWVACPFSRGSFWPRNWTKVSCIVGRFFTNWAIREDCTANESIQKMKRKSTISDNNLQTTHTQRVSI